MARGALFQEALICPPVGRAGRSRRRGIRELSVNYQAFGTPQSYFDLVARDRREKRTGIQEDANTKNTYAPPRLEVSRHTRAAPQSSARAPAANCTSRVGRSPIAGYRSHASASTQGRPARVLGFLNVHRTKIPHLGTCMTQRLPLNAVGWRTARPERVASRAVQPNSNKAERTPECPLKQPPRFRCSLQLLEGGLDRLP